MSTISVHDEQGKRIGSTHTLEIPRIGEALIFDNQTWRVLDVAHPSENQSGAAIHVARVKARVEDVAWLTDNPVITVHRFEPDPYTTEPAVR